MRTHHADWVRKNRWLLLAIAAFIIWKFFLVSVVWSEKTTPPEPDDSYIYTGYIHSVITCPQILCDYPSISFKDSTGFSYLSYRLIWGLFGKMTGLSSLQVYYVSFYLGQIFLAASLVLLFLAWTRKRAFTAFMLVTTGLFHGSGAYHGFFWVVPSFFALVLFFVMLAAVVGRVRYWVLLLLISVPTYLFMHQMSLISLAILVAYAVFITAMRRKFDTQLYIRVATALLVAVVVYAPASWYLHRNTGIGSITLIGTATTVFHSIKDRIPLQRLPADEVARPDVQDDRPNESSEKVDTPAPAPTQTSAETLTKRILRNKKIVTESYINWLFPAWPGIVLLMGIIAVLLFYRQDTILALFAAAIALTGASFVHPYGYRTMLFLWPITFMVYGWGFWYGWKFIQYYVRQSLIRRAIQTFAIAIFILFIGINVTFSLVHAQQKNKSNSLVISPELIQYLVDHTNPDELITFKHKTLHSYSLNTDLITRQLAVGEPTIYSKYVLIVSDTSPAPLSFPAGNLELFFDLSAALFNIPRAERELLVSTTLIQPPTCETAQGGIPLVAVERFGTILVCQNKAYPL